MKEVINLIDIRQNPGHWIELELDRSTGIYERNNAEYFVTKNLSIIDVNTGKELSYEDADNIDCNGYKWLLIYEMKW